MDFYKIIEQNRRKGEIEILPEFEVDNASDLLVKGHDFYAVWMEEKALWSKDILDVQKVVDGDLWKYAEETKKNRRFEGTVSVKTLKAFSTGLWTRFLQFLKGYPDTDIRLDENLTFANTKTKKKDYASKRLPYALESGDHSAWDKLVAKLYEPKEREKIEWMIGAIVSGDSKKIQKFFVFYGEAGSGKSTIINIIQKLFEGYYVTFDAKALGSSTNQFATESFRSNPLVAIQHDGDLSGIEDNTRLNSIVSHEMMVIKEKYKSEYMSRANCFLIMGTNKPVRITDGKSGLLRRLIDIHPTGKKFSIKEYDALMSQIDFELGAIASHCLSVYRDLGKNYFNGYSPKIMIEKTNLFYNFVWEKLADVMEDQPNGISLQQAYEIYKEYCASSNIERPMKRPYFREELKNYFEEFSEQKRFGADRIRSWYSGFRFDKLDAPVLKKEEHSLPLVMDTATSLLDTLLADCPAQYAKEDGSPEMAWSMVTTKLKDIDTSRVHYVLIGDKQHIVVDFDLKNEAGEKDMLMNLEAASKFPPTYAEFSKGGSGVHLHYIYDGDVDKLSSVYAPGVEIKVFRGLAALRRRVSKCNDIPVAVLNGGLPLKEEKVIDVTRLEDQEHLVNIIKKCLRKEVEQPFTRPCIDLIAKKLDDAYKSGMHYDVRDMEHDIFQFALQSSNQSNYCVKKVREMKFCAQAILDEEAAAAALVKAEEDANEPIIFFDCEVFLNLFLANWKEEGEGKLVHRMINPTPSEIEVLLKKKLVGFNCRKYDNHMLYACYLGYTIKQIFDLSQRIIVEGAREAFFPEAYNISYMDLYDVATVKQSLKKWEIQLRIHHQELGLRWDQPVPESEWELVAAYCDNDVLATEAVWNAIKPDIMVRKVMSELSGLNVNATNRQHITKILVGDEKRPNHVYTDLTTGEQSDGNKVIGFPGYEYKKLDDGKYHNMYRGTDVGRGGYVYAEPGIYYNVALMDVRNMHGASIENLNKFGSFTRRYAEIRKARNAIKAHDFKTARGLLDGKLAPYLENEENADQLANALKLILNSTYGIAAASFDNPLRDPRDVNNIIALRGALFMRTLQDAIIEQGFRGIHYKTDSVKIPNATPEIIQFVMEFGEKYGYEFEHEATYERMCLVNDAVYIARYDDKGIRNKGGKHANEWTATGAEFQHPYIFKTLFSGEPVTFSDYCETKSVTGGAIYLDMNEGFMDVTEAEKERDRRIYNRTHPGKEKKLSADWADYDDAALENYISQGHAYSFVGRVGQFVAVQKGVGGGTMLREKDGKYYAVTGTKGYRWLESELVEQNHMEHLLDMDYYDELIRDAIASIREWGSYEEFVGIWSSDISKADDGVPCGDNKRNSCIECPMFDGDKCGSGYSADVKEGGSNGLVSVSA